MRRGFTVKFGRALVPEIAERVCGSYISPTVKRDSCSGCLRGTEESVTKPVPSAKADSILPMLLSRHLRAGLSRFRPFGAGELLPLFHWFRRKSSFHALPYVPGYLDAAAARLVRGSSHSS